MDVTETLEELIKEYCTYNSDYDDLRTWVFRCLRKSIDNHPSATVKDTYNHCACQINYLADSMIFSILKSKPTDTPCLIGDEVYEVGVWVSAYLMDNFGQTALESIQKEVFFSELDIYELSQEITYDINEWCGNIENVFRGLAG